MPNANLANVRQFRQQPRACAAPPQAAARVGVQPESRAPGPRQQAGARAAMPRPGAAAEVELQSPAPWTRQRNCARAETPWPTARAGLWSQGLLLGSRRARELGQRGRGEVARPWGIRERSARSPAPPPDFLCWPLIPTSAQALTASAPPLESPLLLGRGPGAATSWRLPLKRPGLGVMHSDAGQAAEGQGGERTRAEGASDGASPLLSSRLPTAAPAPSSPTPPPLRGDP